MASVKSVKEGSQIVFKGYDADVPEDDRVLTEGETYEVVEVDTKEKKVVVEIDNPGFNPRKKVTEENAKTIQVEVFEEEFDLPEAAEEEAPAKKTAAKGKAATKTPAKSETKAPAKASKTAAKGKAAPPAEEPGDEEAIDDGVLEEEDEEIAALVSDTDDLLALAKELDEESAAHDWKLGGVLYHVRLDKAYETLDKRYKENGGFELYVQEHLNIEYRKAMALIQIYYNCNKFGVDPKAVTEMGWTKAWKIAQVMDEDNAQELVELASESTVADLVENIKASYVNKGGSKGDKKKLITFKFRLFEDQAEGVRNTLEAAAEALGLKNLDAAFEHIVQEWGTEHAMTGKKASVGKRVSAPAKAAAKAPAKAAARARR